MPEPLRIAIVNDYELVVRGVAAMLAPFDDRVRVVELDTGMPIASDVDVVLYDTFGQPQGEQIDLASIVGEGSATRLAVYSWNVEQAVVDASFGIGIAGYVPKSVTGEALVDMLERIHAGEVVRPPSDGDEPPGDVGEWPGRYAGLTPRESEVLALICQGFSNNAICRRTHLSLNTLKGYIRNLYAKIGVTTRANAILWGIDHGFRPDRMRELRD